ncbi:esterase [Pseudoalteromonas ruthenica]|uniref:Esterase n=2 Tax=Pseudoalteromonas TaxID=53246 RepID=A0A5S3Z3N6_9GAMM|nr:alpha/beta hydrolase-fold protein [Pseudoalteromonas ruthenica]TMP86884.1 esterase [Pseudoalteromonas ruthenica]
MKTLLWALLWVFSFSSHAQTRSEQGHTLSAKPEIKVILPASYSSERTKDYPVIYVLDGKLNAQLVASMLARLAVSQGAREHIVVGIEPANRLHDFAPTVNTDPRGPVGEGGGAPAFIEYLESELIPEVNSQYRTSGYNTLAGHSIAGLFVIHAFHSRPTLFQAHLAFSPALWWSTRATAQRAEQYVISGITTPSFLYLNIGNEAGEMKSVYSGFTNTIARNRSVDLILQLEEFTDTPHDLTMTAGLYNALTGLNQYQQGQKVH